MSLRRGTASAAPATNANLHQHRRVTPAFVRSLMTRIPDPSEEIYRREQVRFVRVIESAARQNKFETTFALDRLDKSDPGVRQAVYERLVRWLKREKFDVRPTSSERYAPELLISWDPVDTPDSITPKERADRGSVASLRLRSFVQNTATSDPKLSRVLRIVGADSGAGGGRGAYENYDDNNENRNNKNNNNSIDEDDNDDDAYCGYVRRNPAPLRPPNSVKTAPYLDGTDGEYDFSTNNDKNKSFLLDGGGYRYGKQQSYDERANWAPDDDLGRGRYNSDVRDAPELEFLNGAYGSAGVRGRSVEYPGVRPVQYSTIASPGCAPASFRCTDSEPFAFGNELLPERVRAESNDDDDKDDDGESNGKPVAARALPSKEPPSFDECNNVNVRVREMTRRAAQAAGATTASSNEIAKNLAKQSDRSSGGGGGGSGHRNGKFSSAERERRDAGTATASLTSSSSSSHSNDE